MAKKPKWRPDDRRLRPRLTYKQVLCWADAHYKRTGDWPWDKSGRIVESPENTWLAVSAALTYGGRGLPGGSSLARFLKERRGRYNVADQEPLTHEKILRWADEHRARTGRWPNGRHGPVRGQPHETWHAIESALNDGLRGLPGKGSLARLLDEHRPQRKLNQRTILAWADGHFARNGTWPTEVDGAIPGAPGENWNAVGQALAKGRRGLPGGCSLAEFLAKHRGYRNPARLPRLTSKLILAWVDDHRRRTGEWPTRTSGAIIGTNAEKWFNVDAALRAGRRGLAPGSSLARLLAKRRGFRNQRGLPALTDVGILRWADAHHRRIGRWPGVSSGSVEGHPGETWRAIDGAMRDGIRSLPGGHSLAGLLAERRGVPNSARLPRLTIRQILEWADAHYERTGRWPNVNSGTVVEASGEFWGRVSQALHKGGRGLRGGTTLARLLVKRRGARSPKNQPRLTATKILRWADAHYRRTGEWPTNRSGPIGQAPGEKWINVDAALRIGNRGLPGGSSLSAVLDQAGRIRRYARRVRVTRKPSAKK